ncbi:hypothetical protein L596_001526 [Steinernema carpocapsae]|uniref:PPM-type phosphatase domain-containing protein n=1 Tax=Steinernema carpocapsae TaxID=34508 RepID=A0A4U8UNI5_STECR|nr:hypothetical protein L596_001526 [Steinernema carpocapsae]
MPSSFIRKRVYGLIRTTFTPSQSSEDDALGGAVGTGLESGVIDHHDPQQLRRVQDPNSTPSSDNSFISQCITAGRHGRPTLPEIYAGKTGLDLPVIHLQTLRVDVKATDTGPEGGLTQVEEMRRNPIVNMANLDDELNLSMDGELPSDEEDEDEEEERMATLRVSRTRCSDRALRSLGQTLKITILPDQAKKNKHINPNCETYSWEQDDDERATGMSVSLYEKNPVTGIRAGTPIADVYGVIARENNAVLALADGVNWGEGARLAARCAVRGALDHLNAHIEDGLLHTTTDVFHCLLGAFHAGHALILQEGGLLTTLCVAVAVPVKNSDAWVLCVCNVGDSLCFVFNESYGVREVTLASHDIGQMRDMRDAGGALGPVDGRNPQLQNLTCSMTFIEKGDLVFITSDGVSDNFDPVVGKFCVIKRNDTDKENNTNGPVDKGMSVTVKDSSRNDEFARTRRCKATLPCVDALQRHELMLLRMNDIVLNGFQSMDRDDVTPRRSVITAKSLCHNLIQFAHQLSMAKRRTLEDPELYKNEKLSKSEERARRKMVRGKIVEMPGKLDHASVVAYKIGWWDGQPDDLEYEEEILQVITKNSGEGTGSNSTINEKVEIAMVPKSTLDEQIYARRAPHEEILTDNLRANMKLDLDPLDELQTPRVGEMENGPRSPYEEQPINWRPSVRPKKKHARGSIARHTLGVDVAWLKRLIPTKTADKAEESKNDSRHSLVNSERNNEHRMASSLRQRLRGILGSSRNLKTPVDRAASENCRQPSASATTSPQREFNQVLA